MDKNKKFLIIGLGLIGGSYAMGLSKKGFCVNALDMNQQSIEFALKNRIIQRGADFDVTLINQADIVVFALYPKTMIDWILNYQKHFKPGAIITDVSGVKCNVVDVVQDNLRKDVEFIASHPMAGKELSGVEYSDCSIFKEANFIITPTQKNTQNAISIIKEIAALLEFRNITCLSPQEHDEMIGFVSQLTHAIAVSLMNCNDNIHLKEYTGDSFRDLTRIARINELLWSELFLLNKTVLIKEIDAFVNELNHLKYSLIENDEKELKTLFIQSTQRRKQFDQ